MGRRRLWMATKVNQVVICSFLMIFFTCQKTTQGRYNALFFMTFFSNFDIARFVNHLEIVYCLITFFQASELNFG